MSELDRASLDRTLPPRSGSADWDEVLRGAGAGRERRGRRLVAVVAALLVLVVGTASAFGTVRGLFGDGTRGGGDVHAIEGKRGSFFLRDVFITTRRRPYDGRQPIAGLADRGCATGPALPRASTRKSPGADGMSDSAGSSAGVARAPRGLRDPPGRSEAARRDHEKGRPQGVFVLTPLQPGILKRDSGTLAHGAGKSGGESSPEPPRTPPASSRTCRSRTRCSSCISTSSEVTEG